MNTPKVYLISRTLTDEQKEQVQQALSITPLAAIIVADPRDLPLALSICDKAQVLHHPVAVLAEFEHPLTAVNEDGSLTTLEI
jgi:hypothetical protein